MCWVDKSIAMTKNISNWSDDDEEGDDAIAQLEDDEENLVGSDSCMT